MSAQRPFARRMADELDATMNGLLEPGRAIALVNFPNHNNPGDNAIWLGTHAVLGRIGVPVGYASNWSSFSEPAMRRAVGDAPLLLNGGGNFGDLYAGQQGLREYVLAHCTDRPVIQLPQSICFERPENLERVRRLCESHPAFTLLVRERRSLAFAQRRLNVRTLLAPDMAFGLGPLEAHANRAVSRLWIARQDREKIARTPPPADVVVLDWLAAPLDDEMSPFTKSVLELNLRLGEVMREDPVQAERRWQPMARTFDRLARAWVSRGVRILASADVVITDRLHAHLLAVQLGVRHVVLDNSYGKVRSSFETWTEPAGLAAWAETTEEALSAAEDLRVGPRR